MRIDRRTFLKQGCVAVATLSIGRLTAVCESAEVGSASVAAKQRGYSGWADVYREKWSWDSVARGTHYVNCAYQRGCAWNVYVKAGVVWREEQVSSYTPTNAWRWCVP